MSSEPRRGRLIVISGPSGSGKSTLWKRLVQLPGVAFSVSATTRPPRPGEVNGRDYRFVSDEDFDRLVREDAFLEWAEVHGRRYGTLLEDVRHALEAGKDLVLEIDVQGAEQVRRHREFPSVSIFVMPPSLEELERRLRGRRSETEEQIQRRLSIAAGEMQRAGEYDHKVVNDDLERMVAEVCTILGYEEPAEEGRG